MRTTSLLERRKDEGKAKVEHWRKMGKALEEDEKSLGGGYKLSIRGIGERRKRNWKSQKNGKNLYCF